MHSFHSSISFSDVAFRNTTPFKFALSRSRDLFHCHSKEESTRLRFVGVFKSFISRMCIDVCARDNIFPIDCVVCGLLWIPTNELIVFNSDSHDSTRRTAVVSSLFATIWWAQIWHPDVSSLCKCRESLSSTQSSPHYLLLFSSFWGPLLLSSDSCGYLSLTPPL